MDNALAAQLFLSGLSVLQAKLENYDDGRKGTLMKKT
jgi:hypothetical protein